ncbi:MAG: Crp/Fnr family transcriptional regulator [Candidatus Sulfotelmatobacter sp.]
MPKPQRCRPARDYVHPPPGCTVSAWDETLRTDAPTRVEAGPSPASEVQTSEIDPLYLFACHVEWEQREEPSAAWELISATRSTDSETRAHALALLAASRHLCGIGLNTAPTYSVQSKRDSNGETDMKAPYGLDIVEDCTECPSARPDFFCGFSHPALLSLNQISHKSTLPAGAILFVEGQSPRGMFILCSGRVNLSTTSREGKVLILKTAEAGEALGLSAAVSGACYETTAETATPCQLNFVDRGRLLELMQDRSEVGLRAAQSLSRDYHSAYRDIHDLVLTRSSAGKLARLLLSHSRAQDRGASPTRIHSFMTHEEMAQRIGSSRETVTRLLSDLRRRRLIHLDGPTLVIHDREALEALAV